MVNRLLKIRFARLFATLMGKGKSGSRKASVLRTVAIAVLILYCVGVFAFMSTLMAIMIGRVMIPAGADWLYFAMFSLATLSILFIFSIFETKSELFECSDNELMLSMPIHPRSIVLSRIITVLLYNYLEELIIMLPCIIVYAVFAKSIVGVIGGILVSLILPLLAISMASGVGYLLALVSRRVRKKTLVNVILTFAFLAAYFFGYSKLVENFDRVLEFLINDIDAFIAMVPALYHLGAVALLKPLNATLAVALTAAIAALAYFVISASYVKIVTQTQNADRAKYKGEIIRSKSAFSALVRKEFGRLFSSSIYIINSTVGVFMILAIGIYALVERTLIRETAAILAPGLGVSVGGGVSVAAITVLLALASSNTAAASALSLEGKSLWCIKTIPVRAEIILISKTMPQIIIVTPAILAASVMLIIATDAPYAYWPLIILTPIVANVAFAFFGMLINVLIPKFDFENDAQVVKNSGAISIVVLTQMFFSLGVAALSVFCVLRNLSPLGAILPAAIFIVIGILCYFLLVGPGVRRFNSYSA